MEEVLRYRTDGQITIYEATAQLLDNGYVRYNIDFSASKGRLISFFDPPNGNRFMRIRYSETTGERETIVVDIKQEDNNAISTITMNFYEGNKNSAWVFINTVHFKKWSFEKEMQSLHSMVFRHVSHGQKIVSL